jgi:Ca2+-binding EF-hand superfamily protein
MVVMEQGAAHVGKWMTEETNMLDDYRKAFGIEPPASASIAIMNDSDDTGEYAVSYVDFLEVYGQ